MGHPISEGPDADLDIGVDQSSATVAFVVNSGVAAQFRKLLDEKVCLRLGECPDELAGNEGGIAENALKVAVQFPPEQAAVAIDGGLGALNVLCSDRDYACRRCCRFFRCLLFTDAVAMAVSFRLCCRRRGSDGNFGGVRGSRRRVNGVDEGERKGGGEVTVHWGGQYELGGGVNKGGFFCCDGLLLLVARGSVVAIVVTLIRFCRGV